MAESGTKEDLKTALDGLESLLADSDEALNAQMQPQYESIYKQYYDLLYQAALDYLQNARFAQAVEYLQQIPPEYPCIVELLCYARAQTDVDNSDTSHHLKTVLSSLEQIPAEYDGPFSEDIVAFRADLLDMITDAETREEQEKAEREEMSTRRRAIILFIMTRFYYSLSQKRSPGTSPGPCFTYDRSSFGCRGTSLSSG